MSIAHEMVIWLFHGDWRWFLGVLVLLVYFLNTLIHELGLCIKRWGRSVFFIFFFDFCSFFNVGQTCITSKYLRCLIQDYLVHWTNSFVKTILISRNNFIHSLNTRLNQWIIRQVSSISNSVLIRFWIMRIIHIADLSFFISRCSILFLWNALLKENCRLFLSKSSYIKWTFGACVLLDVDWINTVHFHYICHVNSSWNLLWWLKAAIKSRFRVFIRFRSCQLWRSRSIGKI